MNHKIFCLLYCSRVSFHSGLLFINYDSSSPGGTVLFYAPVLIEMISTICSFHCDYFVVTWAKVMKKKITKSKSHFRVYYAWNQMLITYYYRALSNPTVVDTKLWGKSPFVWDTSFFGKDSGKDTTGQTYGHTCSKGDKKDTK